MATIAEARTEKIQFRLTPDQKEAVDQLAQREGLTRSDFVLQALSKYILEVCRLETQKLLDANRDGELSDDVP